MELTRLTIHQARERLKNREISSRELTQAFLDRIQALDSGIGAFITVDAEGALKQAEAADRRIAGDDITPLSGIPLALKDLICTQGLRTTCASRVLADFIPPYDATVTAKLKTMGAVLLGKLNMDEFAMGSSTEHSAFHPTRNPWNRERIPGGSSGGSAAAVAADFCLAALGSDTGGSIRQPASHCGVVGLKPTYGRVSRFGLVAFASSLDQIGPLAKDIPDCALMLNAVAGYDPADSTSVDRAVPDFSANLDRPLGGLRIGLPREYYQSEGLDPDVAGALERALATLKELGAETVSISLPHTAQAVATYYVIAPCEASSNLARYDGVKYGYRDPRADELLAMYRQTRSTGFGPEVQRRILLGTYALSAGYYDAYYGKASQVRTLIRDDFTRAFGDCDLIASPVAPTPAFPMGANVDDPLEMYLADVFTLAANLAGIPGLSVPCGFSGEHLPIGMQLMGKPFDEATLLNVGHQFQQATDYHLVQPPL